MECTFQGVSTCGEESIEIKATPASNIGDESKCAFMTLQGHCSIAGVPCLGESGKGAPTPPTAATYTPKGLQRLFHSLAPQRYQQAAGGQDRMQGLLGLAS